MSIGGIIVIPEKKMVNFWRGKCWMLFANIVGSIFLGLKGRNMRTRRSNAVLDKSILEPEMQERHST